MINTLIQTISFGFLLIGSFYFGYAGQPTEMGLSILAGVLSLAFSHIDKISKFKGAGFEAEMREKVEAMVAKDSEPSPDREMSPVTIKSYSLDGSTRRVIQCLGNSRYTWRTVSGITQEASYTVRTVIRALHLLEQDGLAIQAGVGKQVNWGLTEKGRELFNALFPTQDTVA